MEKFNLFNGQKPVSAVIFPRILMFDPVLKVQKGEVCVERFKYKDVYVTIRRPFLSVIDQKVLYTLLKVGEFLRETDLSYDFLYDFANVKEIAGINPTTNWKYFEEILKKYQSIWLAFEKKEEEEFKRIRVSTLAVVHFEMLEDLKGRSIKFKVSFSKEFISLLKQLYLFSIPLSTLKEINKIENPVVYRIVSFFITQNKSQSWELFTLLSRLTPMQFNSKKKKHRIFKSIEENVELLKHYGVRVSEKKNGKNKTYILDFKKPKNIKIQIGKHT